MRPNQTGTGAALCAAVVFSVLYGAATAAAAPIVVEFDPDETVLNERAYLDLVGGILLQEPVGGPVSDGSAFDLMLFNDAVLGASGVEGWGFGLSTQFWLYDPPDPTFPGYAAMSSGPTDFAATNPTYFVAGLFDSPPNPWLNAQRGFLGGLFQTPDAIPHQFWVELGVNPADGSLTLYSAGYDDAAYDPSVVVEPVPEPATVSLVALGAAAMFALRRRRSQR